MFKKTVTAFRDSNDFVHLGRQDQKLLFNGRITGFLNRLQEKYCAWWAQCH